MGGPFFGILHVLVGSPSVVCLLLRALLLSVLGILSKGLIISGYSC